MATYVVGDIHGNCRALSEVLEQIAGEAGDGDTVVFLGDYIDRGPDSKGCVDAILTFRDTTSAHAVCLCGNHEDWMLQTRHDYSYHSWLLVMNGWTTIRSYSPDAEEALRAAVDEARGQLYWEARELQYDVFFNAMPDTHHAFFERLLTHYRTGDCFCSHAGVDPTRDIDAQVRLSLLSGASAFPNGYRGGELVVYGHWNNARVDAGNWPHPRIVGQTVGLDSSRHGVVTAMRFPDRRVFQSQRYVTRWTE